MVEYYTIGAWTALAIVGSGYYYYSQSRPGKIGRNQKNRTMRRTSELPAVARQSGKSKDVEGYTSQDGSDKKKANKSKPKTKKSAAEVKSSASVIASEPVDTIVDASKEKASDLEFARQFSAAQQGTVAAAKSQSSTKQKSVKQSKAAPHTVTAINDADREVDETPVDSSPSSATTSKTKGGIDVSDMLEEPAAAPAVLRVTSPTQPAATKEKKPAAAAQPAETKKQRQNRKKNEEKKAAREAEEAERRKLEEQQRRTARIAEGRAAKDGAAFLAANPPSKSAWTEQAASNNGTTSNAPAGSGLLDTFEDAPKAVKASKSSKDAGVLSNLLSEEEQMRLISEDSGWEAVPSKKNKKATSSKTAPETVPAAQENIKPVGKVLDVNPKEIHQQQQSFAPLQDVGSNFPALNATANGFAQDDEWEVS